ncbi:hypothetical protein MY3296_001551 [Beauveria thailandica]
MLFRHIFEGSGRGKSTKNRVRSFLGAPFKKSPTLNQSGEASKPDEALSATPPPSSVTKNVKQVATEDAQQLATEPASRQPPVVQNPVGDAATSPVAVSETETTRNKDASLEETGGSPCSQSADCIPEADARLQNPNSQDASSQTPGDGIEASLGDVYLGAAANITATTPNTELPALEKASEHLAEQLWHRAFRRLRETLSNEDTVGWLNACGVSVQHVRRSSMFTLLDSNKHITGTYFLRESLIAHQVYHIAISLRPAPSPLDEDEEHYVYVERVAKRNRIGEGRSDDEAGGDVQEAQETEQETDQDKAQAEAEYDSDADSNDDEALAQCLSEAPPTSDENAFAPIMSIIGNIEGYVALFKTVLRTGGRVPGISSNSPVDALVALYESVLLFNVRATIQVVNQDAGQQIHLREEIDGIAACMNKLIVSLDLLGIQPQISALLKAIRTKDSGLEMDRKRTLSKLGVADANPASQTTLENSDILERFIALASSTQVYKDFMQWGFDENEAQKEGRILWVRSSPGAGKTILLRAMVQGFPHAVNTSTLGPFTPHVTFSFRQSGRRRRYWDDFALDAVKDLIYNLLLSQPGLGGHLEKLLTTKYAGNKNYRRNDFDAPGDFAALSMLLCRMVRDEQFQPTYFVLDGIDQGIEPENQEADSLDQESDLVRLLGLVTTTAELSSKVKWILSADDARWAACNREMVELYGSKMQYQLLDLDTDLQAEKTAKIARDYAADRVVNISSSRELEGCYNNSYVRQSLLAMVDTAAPNNFLWTKLALLRITQASTLPWNAATMLGQLATRYKTFVDFYAAQLLPLSFFLDLDMDSSLRGPSLTQADVTYCKSVLATATTAYLPLTVLELVALSGLPPAVELPVLVKTLLPSFLEISDDGMVHFTHLSARDYVRQNLPRLSGVEEPSIHTKIAQACLTVLLRKLRCSHDSFASRNNHSNSVHDNIGRIDYAICMWIRHLSEPCSKDNQSVVELAVHLLTGHLEEWLTLVGSESNTLLACLYMMRQLHAAIAPTDDTRLPPQYDHQNGPARSSTPTQRIIREAIIVLQRCHHRSRSLKGAPKEGAIDELGNWLLFAADLPNLRSRLMPVRFPWIETPPRIQQTDASASCLHAIDHGDWVRGCCFSPNGKLVASACDDNLVRLWDARTGNLQLCFDDFEGLGDRHFVRGVAMSSPGLGPGTQKQNLPTLLAAFTNDSIKAWDVSLGKLVITIEGLTERVQHIALSPDSTKLAAATDCGLIVWKNLSLKPVQRHRGVFYSESYTECVAFSPDGKLIASAQGPCIRIWHTGESKMKISYILPMQGPNWEGFPQELEDEPDPEGQEEETGAEELDAIEVGQEESVRESVQDSTSDSDKSSASDSDKNSASDSDKNSASDSDQESVQQGHTSNITCLAFSPDSRFLVSSSDDKTARVWDMGTRKTAAVLEYHKRYVNSVTFSPDGSCIVTGSGDNTIAIWRHKSPGNWGNGGEGDDGVTDAKSKPETRTWPDRILYGHDSSVLAVASAPPFASRSNSSASFLLASSSIDHQLRIWDIDASTHHHVDGIDPAVLAANAHADDSSATGSVLLQGHRSGVCCVAVSPDEKVFATASYDGMLCFWETTTGAQLGCSAKRNGHSTEVLVMTFSPNSKLLVTASVDRAAFVWDVSRVSVRDAAREPLVPRYRFKHGDWPRDAVFDRDGRLVATGCDDGKVRVFGVSTAGSAVVGGSSSSTEIVLPQNTFDAKVTSLYVYCVAFSPDGKFLAAGGDDRCLRIWRLDGDGGTESPEFTGEGATAAITGAVYLDDGNKVITVGRLGIAVWTLQNDRSAPLRPKIIPWQYASPNGYDVLFRRMRFDLVNYPGIVFTEHGPVCLDLDKDAEENSYDDETVDRGGWYLPRSGVDDGSIMWNDHVIALPDNFKVTEKPFAWLVQGRVMVVGCEEGQVLLFRFAEDAYPRRR